MGLVKAMGYIFARLIYKGVKKIGDVPDKYVDSTKSAYRELYGVEL